MEIQKRKNVRGRIVEHVAVRAGQEWATGRTPAEARENGERAIENALARLSRGSKRGVWRGHRWEVTPTDSGWEYWLDTFSRPDYTCSVTCQDREDAENAALHHLAGNVWTHSVENDHEFVEGLPHSIRKDLLGAFAWQRGHKALRDRGFCADCAHRYANDPNGEHEKCSQCIANKASVDEVLNLLGVR